MIETDEVGQKKIDQLIKSVTDPVFNKWEQDFILDLQGKKYPWLNKNQKAVVTRLWDWLEGK